MTDLKDMCLISKAALRELTLVLSEDNGWVTSVVMQALKQGLSGMVVVPRIATNRMVDAGDDEIDEAEFSHAAAVYEAMIAAAPKLEDTDGNL